MSGVRIVLGVVVLTAVVMAQEHPLVPDHPGSWQTSPPIAPRLPAGLTADERIVVTTAVNQVFAILRRMPQLAPPAGFQVIPHAFAALENLDHSDGKRPAYVTEDIDVNLAPYERIDRRVDVNERDTAAHIDIKVNDLQPLLGSDIGLSDDQGAFISNPPEPAGEVHGYPVFEEGNGDRWIMIRRQNVPFFAPVSAGRFMLAKIRDAERQVAEARDRRAKMPAGVPATIVATVDDAIAQFQRQFAALQRAYTAMSASERSAPARLVDSSSDGVPAFAAAGDSGATAIVYFNPALMDAALPRTTPQLLAINIGAKDDLFPGLADKLDKELDWAALEKFIHQR